MRGLGFECVYDGDFNAKRKFTIFWWRKEWPGGADPFRIYLTVHHDPDDIDVKGICRPPPVLVECDGAQPESPRDRVGARDGLQAWASAPTKGSTRRSGRRSR